MSTEFEDIKETMVEKPQVFLKNITFNDDTPLPLKHDSIIVFTGANNSGKSQVLRDVELCLDESNQTPPIVIRNIEGDYYGVINEPTFLNERFYMAQQGQHLLVESGCTFNLDTLQQWWKEHTLYNGLHMLFVKRLSTEIRLTSSNALSRFDQPEKHPIYKLNRNEETAEKSV